MRSVRDGRGAESGNARYLTAHVHRIQVHISYRARAHSPSYTVYLYTTQVYRVDPDCHNLLLACNVLGPKCCPARPRCFTPVMCLTRTCTGYKYICLIAHVHTPQHRSFQEAEVCQVHSEVFPAYFSIRLSGGREKQTEGVRLLSPHLLNVFQATPYPKARRPPP